MTNTESSHHGHQSFWLWIMCLTGVDYFSTLGYQPSIAFENAGLLAPFATVVLVVVTLLGALPVYRYVAGQSPHGQGSIAMLERLVHGWKGKFLVLALLGFAATDYVITKTLSAADAAEHFVHNPLAKHAPEFLHSQILVTMVLLVALGAMFLRGFREVIGMSVVIVGVFLVLNLFVIGCGLVFLLNHPERVTQWLADVQEGRWHVADAPAGGAGWWTIWLAAILLSPKLALGLSGFETGVAVMPLVKGDPSDTRENPRGRIRNTRKLLLTAAVIMSVLLLGSSAATSMLIPPDALAKGGKAYNRALAFLAHGEGAAISPAMGEVFGTIYDISTIVILWFAGASAMSGLLNLVPQYLPRYGMAPEWARVFRPLVVLFTLINLVVTWVFDADVQKQGGAYATGVMVLISSACLATVIDRYRKGSGPWPLRVPWAFVLITVAFLFITGTILWEKPDGIKIAGCFIAAIMVSSLVSRTLRSTELRFTGFQFSDEQSRFLWDSMKHLEFPVLVPHRPGRIPLAEKERIIRAEHHLSADVPIVFIEAKLGDPSEFLQAPLLQIAQEEGVFTLHVSRCNSVSHVIAALGLELSKVGKPPEIHFGWSDESPLAANLGFVLFGQGNVPWMVRELILKAQPDPALQPKVIVG